MNRDRSSLSPETLEAIDEVTSTLRHDIARTVGMRLANLHAGAHVHRLDYIARALHRLADELEEAAS